MNLDAVKNPSMDGVAAQINWRDIEPVEGKPDWSQLDALFAAATAAKKWVHLDNVSRFLLSGMGARGRPDRRVPDPLRARRRHARAAADAVGSRLSRALVRVHEAAERALRRFAGIPHDRRGRSDLGVGRDDPANPAGAARNGSRRLYASQVSGRMGRGVSLLRHGLSPSMRLGRRPRWAAHGAGAQGTRRAP